jgi:hypothetical protein
MYRKNTKKKIHESNENNTNHVFSEMKTRFEELIDESLKKLNVKNSQSVADVVRENVIECEKIKIGANSIAKKRVDERGIELFFYYRFCELLLNFSFTNSRKILEKKFFHLNRNLFIQ